jgi:hypothetical protein
VWREDLRFSVMAIGQQNHMGLNWPVKRNSIFDQVLADTWRWSTGGSVVSMQFLSVDKATAFGEYFSCMLIALRAIAPMMGKSEVDLDGRELRDGEAMDLADSMRRHRVRVLHLENNMIGPAGAVAVAAALATGQLRLEELSLANNLVGDEGAQALLAAVPHSALRHLDLSGNGVSALLLGEIEEALRRNEAQKI